METPIIEEWRIIPSHPDYAASSLGRIKRLTSRTSGKAGRILKQVDRGNGYLCVTLNISGKWRNANVHNLVAEAFLDKPFEGAVVNHKNGVRPDNRLENIEYVSQSANVRHAYERGFQSREQNRGERNGVAKLREKAVLEILAETDRARGYQTRLARKYGVAKSVISEILTGKAWRHLTSGQDRPEKNSS